MDKLKELQEVIDHSQRIVFFGGAGVSTESNIPDFRSSDGVYSVTLGRHFTAEQLVMMAGISTYVAAYTAGWVISDHALYKLPVTTWSLQVFWLLPIIVLVLTPLAYVFARLTKQATAHRIKDKRILLTLPLAFLFLAGLAQKLPHLLGNGRMVAQEVINGISWKTAILLFVLKALVVLLTLWAGAYGGTLTPSFALGMAGAALFTLAFGLESPSTILLIGAVCFLTVTLKAPCSATGLVIGFTGQGLDALPYLLLTAFLTYGLTQRLDRIMVRKLKESSNR